MASSAIRTLKRFFSAFVSGQETLAGRLVRLASMWFIISLVITGVALTAYFRHVALERFQIRLFETADQMLIATNIAADGMVEPPPYLDPRANVVNDDLDNRAYWQVSEIVTGGEVVERATSRSLRTSRIEVPPEIVEATRMTPGKVVYYDAVGQAGEPVRVAAIYSRINERSFVFLAAENRSGMDEGVRRFGLMTGLALAVMALGSLFAIFLQVRIGLSPLYGLTGELGEIRKGNQSRVEHTYPAEIAPVAQQVNGLLDYAQETVERQRTHVGNLAHALKTPLSVLLTAAADGPEAIHDTVRRQVESMKGHVDHHLRRARAAARATNMGERTAVEPVLDELAVMMEQVFRDKGVIIDWRAPEDLSFRGEKQDFLEIAGNLVENACIWCQRNVRILTDFDAEANTLSLHIEDDGPGLEEARFDEVLKRGTRLDESVPGTGLGLSIVDELVRAYGGGLSFSRSSMGGLKVSVILPAHKA